MDLGIGKRVEDLMRSCERYPNEDTQGDCPLCLIRLPSLTEFQDHVGGHLRELSLFAMSSDRKISSDYGVVEVEESSRGANVHFGGPWGGPNESD